MGEFGELVPTGGGETIVLKKTNWLSVAAKAVISCVLRFANVSSQHARLTLESGYWFVKDLASRNGTKVNGFKIDRKRLDPEAVVSFASIRIRFTTIQKPWARSVLHRLMTITSKKSCVAA